MSRLIKPLLIAVAVFALLSPVSLLASSRRTKAQTRVKTKPRTRLNGHSRSAAIAVERMPAAMRAAMA